MPKRAVFTPLYYLTYLFLLVFATSCSTSKFNLASSYLDSTHTVQLNQYPFKYKEPTIQPYEYVQVKFAGLNPTVSSTLNNYGGATLESSFQDRSGAIASGQQVDRDGFLNFPIVGKVLAKGLTVDQLRDSLLERVKPLLQEPYVFVALPKRGITVLGEVKTASTVVFSKEKANLFEVLAQAGYATQFADISKVKVYREDEDGKRVLAHLDLTDTTFFGSEYFYPRPNDVIYIPASKVRSLQAFGGSIAPIVTMIVSLATIAITLTR